MGGTGIRGVAGAMTRWALRARAKAWLWIALRGPGAGENRGLKILTRYDERGHGYAMIGTEMQ